MIKNTLKLVVCLLLTTSLKSAAQKIQTGIYEFDQNVDTSFVNTHLEKYNEQPDPQNPKLKNIYNYKYHQLTDSKYKIKYALVINNSTPENKDSYQLQMIWLNDSIPKNYSVSYSDTLQRKYIGLELVAGIKTQSWNETRYSGEEGFLAYPNLDGVSENDRYKFRYQTQNLYTGKSLFILKSHQFELVKDSSKVDSTTYYSIPLYGSGYRTATSYLTYKQGLATFKLKAAVAYKSFINIKKQVKFYTDPNSRDKYELLERGDFIALTRETGEWYYGEHISAAGERTAGRIFIDDLSSGLIKTQLVEEQELKIKYTINSDNESYSAKGTIENIKIYRNKQLVQVIKTPGLISDTTQLIYPVDVNFDGHLDLQVYSHDGGAGPNYGYNYYLYNPLTKKFNYSSAMSDLSQPAVNSKTKSITAAWRNGAANHGFEKYKWVNRKLTLVEYYETLYQQDDKIEETHRIMINGKMKNKVRIVTDESELNFPPTITK